MFPLSDCYQTAVIYEVAPKEGWYCLTEILGKKIILAISLAFDFAVIYI